LVSPAAGIVERCECASRIVAAAKVRIKSATAAATSIPACFLWGADGEIWRRAPRPQPA
jgi:hypothetical protein